jgi:hypothetical protein
MWKEQVGAYFQETVYSIVSSSFLVRLKKIKKNSQNILFPGYGVRPIKFKGVLKN